MRNPKMLSFLLEEVSRKSAHHVARHTKWRGTPGGAAHQVAQRTRQKNLFFSPKIQNLQKVSQIS